MVWSQECGMVTHEQASIPVVTFRSAAGALKNRQYIDYRREENPKSSFDAGMSLAEVLSSAEDLLEARKGQLRALHG